MNNYEILSKHRKLDGKPYFPSIRMMTSNSWVKVFGNWLRGRSFTPKKPRNVAIE